LALIDAIGVDGFKNLARIAVEAARPLLAAEALKDAADYLYEHRRDGDGSFDFWRMYEAGGPEWLASRAQAALRPAPREN